MTQEMNPSEMLEAWNNYPNGVVAKVLNVIRDGSAPPPIDDELMHVLRGELALREVQQREVDRLVESQKALEAAAASEAVRLERRLLRVAFEALRLDVVMVRSDLETLLYLADFERGQAGAGEGAR